MNIVGGLYLGWGVLGFKRGLQSYDYKYEKNKYYRSIPNDEPKLYSSKIMKGCCGVMFYLNPCLLIISIPKEIYRLEVNLRSLEKEKSTDYYNELW